MYIYIREEYLHNFFIHRNNKIFIYFRKNKIFYIFMYSVVKVFFFCFFSVILIMKRRRQ